MKNNILLILLVGIFMMMSIGCSLMKADGGNKKDTPKSGLDAVEVCKMLDDPVFETRSPYNGENCTGNSSFTGKAAPPASGNRPSFSFVAYGNKDNEIDELHLTMMNREDAAGLDFFVTEAQVIARMINEQPLPKPIEDAIRSSYVPPGSMDLKSEWKIGDAKVALVRASTSNIGYKTPAKVSLSIEMPKSAKK